MIKLTRGDAPSILSSRRVDEGVERFRSDGSAVWNLAEVKDALARMSYGKCAYCELPLGKGAVYLEVEHFYSKRYHPQRVLDWENLYPACRRCNSAKGDWDVAAPGEMMVDPVTMSPNVHIRLDEAYRPVGLTAEGETTVIEIDLGNIRRLGVLRYQLGETVKRKLEELHDLYISLPTDCSVQRRRSVIRKIRALLDLSAEDQAFSAVAATVLMRSSIYASLRDTMMAAEDWDAAFEVCHLRAASASLA